MTLPRSPYTGSSPKLVLAFDIGTTFSGVSYAILDPGVVPTIECVGRFLNNNAMRNFKISSVMFYDRDGNFRGVNGTTDDEEAEDLHRLEWWKLGLSSRELPATAKKYMTPSLPKGKVLQDVFADFIRYLFDSAKAFIKESEPLSDKLREEILSNIDLVLSHPNGWEGREQEILRKSVVQASVFTEEEALSRVSFVTEGEATFNFCVANTKSGELLKPGNKVLVIDAGGGTIDISSFTVKSTTPLKVEESHEPKCSYQGGEIVTARARAYGESRLKGSKFDNKQDIEALAESFDSGLKTTFSNNTKQQYIKFGSLRDNDAGCGVKEGRFTVLGNQVEKFFEPSVSAIIKGVKLVATGGAPESTFVFLAGGFSASPWISQEVERFIATQGLKFSRPNHQLNAAVAVGAVSHYLDHFVVSRIIRYTYGTPVSIAFDPSDPEHLRRSGTVFLGINGCLQLDAFKPTLFKGTRTSGTQEFRESITGVDKFPPTADKTTEFPIIRYTGALKKPRWMDEEEESYKTVSHIRVDAGKIPGVLKMSPFGFPIFIQKFEVIYIYGGTAEIKAQVAWKKDGVEKRGDAAIVYDNE